MISFADKECVINGLLIRNKLVITFPNDDEKTISEANIASESMQLKQSICDEDKLKFGGCIASEFKIDLINTEDRIFTSNLVGKWISVKLTHCYVGNSDVYPATTLYPSSSVYPGKTAKSKEFYIFSGYIDSAKVDANNKNMRNIVAYDVFAKFHEKDATSLLMQVFKSKATNGYKWLKNIFLMCMEEEYNGVIDMRYITSNLNNYMDEIINEANNLTVGRYEPQNDDWLSDNSTISIGEILKSICELLGLFGVIRPNKYQGCFYFMPLQEVKETYDFYESMYVEEYNCTGYTEIQGLNGNEDRDDKINLYQSSDIPDEVTTNIYDITDNVLAWQNWDNLGSGSSDRAPLASIINGSTGQRFYNLQYTPLTATLDGRLWVEVGDKIAIESYVTDVNGSYVYDEDGNAVTETVESYLLSRTITGIQALTDKIEAKGV